jgi:hypothetical protein
MTTMKTKDLYPRAMTHECPDCGRGVHQLAFDHLRCSGAVNFPQTCTRSWDSVEAFEAEARRCWECDKPLADDDAECCKACAAIATESDVKPVAADDLTPEGRACLSAYEAYQQANADYDALDERCRQFMAHDGGAERWAAYQQACRERREAFVAVEAAWDRWMAAAKQAA